MGVHAQLTAALVAACLLTLLTTSSADLLHSLEAFDEVLSPPVIQYPCTKLLHRTGAAGCETLPGKLGRGALALCGDGVSVAKALSRDEAPVLVLPFNLWAAAATQTALAAPKVKCAGVLVLSPPAGGARPAPFSPDAKNGAALDAGGGKGGYPWNAAAEPAAVEAGGSLLMRHFKFAVFWVNASSVPKVTKLAKMNAASADAYPRWSAELGTSMSASASANSIECLKATPPTCDPMTGVSVVGTVGPAAAAGGVLATTGIDSAAFFHYLADGAAAETASTAALIAAARAIAAAGAAPPKPITYALVGNEAYGHAGSRYFGATQGVAKYAFGVALGGVTPVGRACNASVACSTGLECNATSHCALVPATQAFAHYGAGVAAFIPASITAVKSSTTPAGTALPTSPLTGITAAARPAPTMQTAVLSGYDTSFGDKYFHSALDGVYGVTANELVDPVTRLATVAARVVYKLAGGADGAANALVADRAFVAEMLDCMLEHCNCKLANQAGLSVSNRLAPCRNAPFGPQLNQPGTPTDGPMNHYVYGTAASNYAKFLQDLLADSIKTAAGTTKCTTDSDCAKEPLAKVCALSMCVAAQIKQIPAISPTFNLTTVDGKRTRSALPVSAALYPDDPIWTESRWNSADDLYIKLFFDDSPTEGNVVLAAGLVWFAVCMAVAHFVTASGDRKTD